MKWLILVILLSGCSSLPECPRRDNHIIMSMGDPVSKEDVEKMPKWHIEPRCK